MKKYEVRKYFFCLLITDRCLRKDESESYPVYMAKPDCETCDIYLEWKKTGG